MESIQETLRKIVSDAFAACGFDREFGAVGESDRLDLCQFQCNGAFAGAKKFHRPPLAIAEAVAAALRGNPAFAKVEVARPGFLNLTLTDAFLTDALNETARDAHLGIPQAEKPETVVLDYGGPNVAKPLHIGHLRSAVIGESLKRLARACGLHVIGDAHLGDWGLQIGLVIAELSERHPDWACFSPDFRDGQPIPELDADMLNEIYPFASAKSEENEAFKKKAQRITAEFQAGRPGYEALRREILRVSVGDMKGIYQALNVDFDLWYGESDAARYIPELFSVLTEKSLLRESDGAMVVDVAEESDRAPMPPVIIKKSDNSSIYATTDLATIIQRERDFHPDHIWYVVDKRQGLHFEQVFRCAKKAGLVPAGTELAHMGFGTMNGPDGKPFKTREGGVMRLSDLLATVTDAAYAKLQSSSYVSEEDRQDTARKVGLAALKFGDLINHYAKDYVFDLDKFLSFEGKTGTYLLYMVTRIRSVLKKAENGTGGVVLGVYSETQRDLMLNILLAADAFRHALDEKAPNYVAESAYRIASAFSRFYHENRILDEPDPDRRSSYLSLIALTEQLLVRELDILSIEAVESM